ncbi:TetR/AcrR family transcriptional regulator [Listeria costaricensis]|uniref:TetR/AcrR family transcriptional regulator n=1 Tax=Listeria costaricensis TaxID=2026604 RepID=UPI000C074C89|nr:TetR/AcrR family transcriptional regulator [Listeria costaricensis]
MERKKDRRIRKTKAAFHTALLDLLDQKSWKEVTVTDLVQTADVNRTTFYKHYFSKEDLLEEMITEVTAALEKAYLYPYIAVPHFSVQHLKTEDIKIFDHIYTYRHFYQHVVSGKIAPDLEERLCEFIEQLMLADFTKWPPKEKTIDPEMIASYQAHAIYGLIVFWAKNQFSTPQEKMTAQFRAILQHSLTTSP